MRCQYCPDRPRGRAPARILWSARHLATHQSDAVPLAMTSTDHHLSPGAFRSAVGVTNERSAGRTPLVMLARITTRIVERHSRGRLPSGYRRVDDTARMPGVTARGSAGNTGSHRELTADTMDRQENHRDPGGDTPPPSCVGMRRRAFLVDAGSNR